MPDEKKRGPNGGVSSRDDEKLTPRRETKLRAIRRAPKPVQQAYRDGLINQDLAAKLGPRKLEAEFEAKRDRVAKKIAAVPPPMRTKKVINRVAE